MGTFYSFFVDDLHPYVKPHGSSPGPDVCSLITNGKREDLHKFALEIGIPPEQFVEDPEFWHYTLFPAQRDIAVSHGATEINWIIMHKIEAQRDGIYWMEGSWEYDTKDTEISL